MSDRPLLEIVKLAKSFPVRNQFGRQTGEVKAVDEVSFTIARGEVYGLAGESGSGKSTIARMIMGLTRPTSGDILLDGQNITGTTGTRAYGRKVQMVFQNPGSSLNPRRTVGQSIAVPLDAHGFPHRDRDKRIGELLDMVQLPADFASRYPHELSGGMRQRVLIAMALLSEPRLLIADEPGTALDVTTQAQILKLLKDLVEERGLALLMITHNLGVVRETSSYVYVMHNGKIVEEAATADLFANPKEAYTRNLIASVPRLTGGTDFLNLGAATEDAS